MDQPKLDWQQTLDDMERSIGEAMARLEAYEAANSATFEILSLSTRKAKPHPSVDAEQWQDKLREAKQTTLALEKSLIEQEAEWERWRHGVSQWLSCLEQTSEEICSGGDNDEPLRSDTPGGG